MTIEGIKGSTVPTFNTVPRPAIDTDGDGDGGKESAAAEAHESANHAPKADAVRNGLGNLLRIA